MTKRVPRRSHDCRQWYRQFLYCFGIRHYAADWLRSGSGRDLGLALVLSFLVLFPVWMLGTCSGHLVSRRMGFLAVVRSLASNFQRTSFHLDLSGANAFMIKR